MKYFLLIVLPFLLLPRVTNAQWTQTNGPEGGVVLSLAANQDNGHFFAGTKGGVYRSTDAGISWQWVNNGIPANLQITVIHSTGSDTYIFDGSNNVLYYSSNEGTSWSTSPGTGLPLLATIGQLVTSNGKLFAAVSGFTDGGVYVSTDHGSSWSKSGTGQPSNFYAYKICISGSSLFAGSTLFSTTKGIIRSTDNGGTWSTVNSGFTTSQGVSDFTTIGSTVFVSTLASGVFASTNNGDSWTKISPLSPMVVLGAICLTSTSTHLYAGGGTVFKANNTGSSWDTVTTGLPQQNAGTAINALATYNTTILASFSNLGVYRSTDAGAHWTRCNSGMKNCNADGIYVDGTSLYIGGETTGFFRSDDNGDTWLEKNNGIDTRNNGYFGFVRSGSNLFAGGGQYGLFHTSDGGDTWITDTLPKPAYGFFKDGTDLYGAIVGDVVKSTNSGVTWSPLNIGVPFYIAVMSVWKYESAVLAGCSSGGIKRSTDNGATWTAPISGAPTVGGYGYNAFAQVDSTLFVAHGGGVYRSTDRGATWSSASSGLSGKYPTTLHAHGSFLFVGTTTGVYKSSDKGSSWTAINSGFPTNIKINVLTSNDQYLFAGTSHNSVWRVPINQVTPVREISDGKPVNFSLDQNYPNPFNPSTTIRFTVQEAGFASLTIYNILGEEIAELFRDNVHPGTFDATWDASGLPGGIYYYRLTTKTFTAIKSMMYIK